MRTTKASIFSLLAVYYDNKEMIRQSPLADDLIKFFAGKEEGVPWQYGEEKFYDEALSRARHFIGKQYPWIVDPQMKNWGERLSLGLKEKQEILYAAAIRIWQSDGTYEEGNDILVMCPPIKEE